MMKIYDKNMKQAIFKLISYCDLTPAPLFHR